MGYRNYLCVGDKETIQKLRKMNNQEIWDSLNEKFKTDFNKKSFEKDGYISRYDIFESQNIIEIYELGKDVDFYDRIKPFLEPFFNDENIHQRYNEYCELMYAKPELLQEIATIYKEKVMAYQKDLLKEKSDDIFNEKSQLERLIQYVQSRLTWSTYLDKLSENEWSLGGGWLYEHEVFNILYIMKKFNPETQSLLWVGH